MDIMVPAKIAPLIIICSVVAFFLGCLYGDNIFPIFSMANACALQMMQMQYATSDSANAMEAEDGPGSIRPSASTVMSTKAKLSRNEDGEVTTSFPVLVASLPKSGTVTTHKYFKCGGHRSAHAMRGEIGLCTRNNIRSGRPPLEGCGDFDVWSDTGWFNSTFSKAKMKRKQYEQNHKIETPFNADDENSSLERLEEKSARAWTTLDDRIACYFPLIEGLPDFYRWYPNATIVLISRDTESWLRSVYTYRDGIIAEMWKRCFTGEHTLNLTTLEGLREFHKHHKQMIRNFVDSHPSLKYIEAELESEDIASQLEDKTGIPADCWGVHNQQP